MLESSMIDAHHHFWRYNEQDFGWITPEQSVLRADFLPEQLKAECDAVGVDGVISVQARTKIDETNALLEFADECSFIAGVVGWVDLRSPDVSSVLDKYRHHLRFVGVREICQGAADEEYFDHPAFNRGVEELTHRGLTYDILIFPHQLRSAIRFVDRHPTQLFVVDHCAKPPIGRNRFAQDWASELSELALRENVFCKFSGLTTEVRDGSSWDDELLPPYFETVLTAFGPHRVMFGSDWPVSIQSTSYEAWIVACKSLIASLTAAEQSAILGDTALRFYGLRAFR
jgi:L-fuconolactonase